jgi:hypothetical protein
MQIFAHFNFFSPHFLTLEYYRQFCELTFFFTRMLCVERRNMFWILWRALPSLFCDERYQVYFVTSGTKFILWRALSSLFCDERYQVYFVTNATKFILWRALPSLFCDERYQVELYFYSPSKPLEHVIGWPLPLSLHYVRPTLRPRSTRRTYILCLIIWGCGWRCGGGVGVVVVGWGWRLGLQLAINVRWVRICACEGREGGRERRRILPQHCGVIKR